MHANESNMKVTWSRAETPETNETNNCSIDVQTCLEWILDNVDIMLDLEYFDFHNKTLENHMPPESDDHITITTSRMQRIFDVASCIW